MSYIEKDVFRVLSTDNVNDQVEKKMNLTYLSWARAWYEVKKFFPNANYTIYENKDGWNYFHDGKTCWVKVGVIIEGLEHIVYLPIMDNRNNSIPLEKVESTSTNKAILRALTKALAMHGLGLYIYSGEDLPQDIGEPTPSTPNEEAPSRPSTPPTPSMAITPPPTQSVEATTNEDKELTPSMSSIPPREERQEVDAKPQRQEAPQRGKLSIGNLKSVTKY